MGLEEKNISSSGCTGGSAELVSDPNNILFSSHTYRFLMFLPLMLLSVRRRHRWDVGPIQGCRNVGEVHKTAGGKQ